MTNKELSKLRRTELLEILVAQGKEQERLQQELAAAQEAVKGRELTISESGSLAEASLRLNDVVGAAQRAADLYTENVKRVMDQQQQESDRVLADAQSRSTQLLADADKRVRSMLDAANEQVARILQNARAEADRIAAEAGAEAAQTLANARLEGDTILQNARREAGLPTAEEQPKKRRGLFGRRS